MKLVAAIKLKPTREQAAALRATLARCNEACTAIAAKGFAAGVLRQFDLHKLTYVATRTDFGLTAQAAVRCISKVADAFKINRKVAVRGKWMLAATCDIPEVEGFTASDWIGVDLGIVSIAATSDGKVYTGAEIERVRAKFAKRRKELQRKGTKAAKRRLVKLSGKQGRFQKHVNHGISKAIVIEAERTSRGIAVEELTHIRQRVTARRKDRARLSNWSFGQLRLFLAYKAKRAGVPLVAVDPAYTSQGCSCCGLIDKRNRPNQATFLCISCGHSQPADLNAALNIRARAIVTTPESSQAIAA